MTTDRKQDHIKLAFQSRTLPIEQDRRFLYEPLLHAHPVGEKGSFPFLGKTVNVPIWVSSMTGGTSRAHTINHNIARACNEFGMGMGLGSCRKILFSNEHFADFDVRPIIGHDLPLWANLGIAQVEQLLAQNKEKAISEMVKKLQADGLIVHVNPLQEWFQPEGDRLQHPPVDTVKRLIDQLAIPLIVKEVGQGMGEGSLRELLQLPLAAIEFAAFGGTNFAMLEMQRNEKHPDHSSFPFAFIGHTAIQMVQMVNKLAAEKEPLCKQLIISGGIVHVLDGYYLLEKSNLPAVFGMASAILKHASGEYADLQDYVQKQIRLLQLAQAYLKINPDYENG